MKKILLILIILNSSISYGQANVEIKELLDNIGKIENSKDIILSDEAKSIIENGENSLSILSDYFADTTETNVYSECRGFKLRKGEIAIIIADRLEMMPYTKLTGIQNCLLSFCDDNPNLIEYYLYAIRDRGASQFKENYINWLSSSERNGWPPKINNKY